MQNPDFFLLFLKPLNEIKVPYMVTGPMAAMIYGEPRLTHDIDVVVDLLSRKIKVFHTRFQAEGCYVPPVEVLHIEAARKIGGHFNLLHNQTGFKAVIYLKGKDEHHLWAFENRMIETIKDHKIWFAPRNM